MCLDMLVPTKEDETPHDERGGQQSWVRRSSATLLRDPRLDTDVRCQLRFGASRQLEKSDVSGGIAPLPSAALTTLPAVSRATTPKKVPHTATTAALRIASRASETPSPPSADEILAGAAGRLRCRFSKTFCTNRPLSSFTCDRKRDSTSFWLARSPTTARAPAYRP
jgi:hypothetical protein